jgi:hypothetical protein
MTGFEKNFPVHSLSAGLEAKRFNPYCSDNISGAFE